MDKITLEVFNTLKNIFRYSFQGPMVGKKENEFITWEELGSVEQEAYKDKHSYNIIIELFKN